MDTPDNQADPGSAPEQPTNEITKQPTAPEVPALSLPPVSELELEAETLANEDEYAESMALLVDPGINAAWMNTLRLMLEQNMTFNSVFPFDWLEEHFKFALNTKAFGFCIVAINNRILATTGYFLHRDSARKCFRVLSRKDAEKLDKVFEHRVFSNAQRQIDLLQGLIINPKSNNTQEDLERLQAKQDKASWRLQLLEHENALRLAAKKRPSLLGR